MFKSNQFILAKLVPDASGKNLKMPCNASGDVINALDSQHWMSYEQAAAVASTREDLRMAFVFTEKDPYFFVDIDHCLMPDGQSWSPLAYQLIDLFPGAYVEVSQSNTGLHIFGRYHDVPDHACKNVKLGLELYHKDRFVVLGGNAHGDVETDCTVALRDAINTYFPPKDKNAKGEAEWTVGPCEEWNGPEDDDELVQLAISRRSHSEIFNGARVSFQDLWERNVDALAGAWPHDHNEYDGSSADMSLAQRLAFWTGKDCERIRRIMEKSELKRDKWEQRQDYLPRTIISACSLQTQVYAARGDNEDGSSRKFAGGWVEQKDIPEVFDGCAYVVGEHAAVTPDGLRLKPEQFRVMFGGYKFNIDDGKTTRSAWEAFTECPTWRPPVAHAVCFRPENPDFLIEDGGETLANIYRPVFNDAEQGDVSKFLQLIEMMFPDAGDRAVLLNYMAACTQYIGNKFQWAPLLQGPEGNGKTFITNCLMETLGKKYCHVVKASDLAGNGAKFNAWLFGKLFVAIEEIKVGNKSEMMEVLKPLITNEKEEIQAKGKDQFTADNRANFILTSNYIDAINLKADSRRYAPLMAGAQTFKAMMEAGLTPSYFADLWDWAKGIRKYEGQTPGFKLIAYFLENFEIDEKLNPATACVRAPQTSKRDEFIKASTGRVEQEIIEAISAGTPGFRGGWVSASALNQLLIGLKLNTRYSHAKRKQLMFELGFIPHPALPDNGRTTRKVAPHGDRPRLYVKEGSVEADMADPALIAATYEKIQLAEDGVIPTPPSEAKGQVVPLRPVPVAPAG